nr:amidohydrolase family protein [Hartmannibacter diazotrophicus]
MGIADGDFDGHAHVFAAGLPLAAKRRYAPDYEALPMTYAALLGAHGLAGGLLVQPSFLGTDNSYLLSVLDAARSGALGAGLLFRGVVVLDPDDRGITSDGLDQLSRQGIVGMRINAVGWPDSMLQDMARWTRLLKLADAAGWHVELQCEGDRLAPVLAHLLAHCQHVVVDHFGLPRADDLLGCPGQSALLSAPEGRVFVKVSAPYRVLPDLCPSEAVDRLMPVFRRLHEGLGSTQLLWGSDWPWTRFEGRQNFSDCVSWRDRWLAGLYRGS